VRGPDKGKGDHLRKVERAYLREERFIKVPSPPLVEGGCPSTPLTTERLKGLLILRKGESRNGQLRSCSQDGRRGLSRRSEEGAVKGGGGGGGRGKGGGGAKRSMFSFLGQEAPGRARREGRKP